MKFYYAAIYSDLYGDDERQFICSSETKLTKGTIIIIEYNNHFVTCVTDEPLDELEVLTKQYDVRQVLGHVDVTEYLKAKENIIKKQVLLNEMEERSKAVKLMESMKKLASADPQMAKMLEMFNNLETPE